MRYYLLIFKLCYMNEQFKEEQGLPLENIENIKYKEFQQAINEEDGLWAEIDQVFKSSENRGEAEKIVLEKYATRVDEAMGKSKLLFKEWMMAVEETHKNEQAL